MTIRHGKDAATAEATAVATAYAGLRRDIIAGIRRPGERMRIERVRLLYEVGPTPMREALQRLTAEGLVVAHGGRGFQVAPLSAAEFVDLNVARTEVELAALRLSLAHGDERWEANVVAAGYLLERADRLLAGNDSAAAIDRWEEANRAFHTALVAACPSRTLLEVRAAINDKCERYRRATLLQVGARRDIHDEHRSIMQSVLDRDLPVACERLRTHFQNTVSQLQEWLADEAIRPARRSRARPPAAAIAASTR